MQPRAPPPPGGFSKFIFIADKLFFKISYSGRKIPPLATYPPFSQFLGRQWKRRRADLELFRIQPRASPPVGGFSNFIFIEENSHPSSQSVYCSSTINYFKYKKIRNGNELKKSQQELEHVAESKIVPNRHVFIYIFGREI